MIFSKIKYAVVIALCASSMHLAFGMERVDEENWSSFMSIYYEKSGNWYCPDDVNCEKAYNDTALKDEFVSQAYSQRNILRAKETNSEIKVIPFFDCAKRVEGAQNIFVKKSCTKKVKSDSSRSEKYDPSGVAYFIVNKDRKVLFFYKKGMTYSNIPDSIFKSDLLDILCLQDIAREEGQKALSQACGDKKRFTVKYFVNEKESIAKIVPLVRKQSLRLEGDDILFLVKTPIDPIDTWLKAHGWEHGRDLGDFLTALERQLGK